MLIGPLAKGWVVTQKPRQCLGFPDGAKRIRTADPLHAMQVLYQLSYGPYRTQWQRNAGHSAWLVALPGAY
mgnify:CR=1 FL=1